MSEQLTELKPENQDLRIRSCQEGVIKHLSDDPKRGLTTTTMTGVIEDGLVCRVQQGKLSTVMDLGPAMGGEARGPSPGFYAKAGLLGCIAIATKMAAARDGLSFRSVRSQLEVTTDDLAMFGLGSRRAAPLVTRVTLQIDTDEDDVVVSDLIDEVLEADTWFLALRDAQDVGVSWVRQSNNAEMEKS